MPGTTAECGGRAWRAGGREGTDSRGRRATGRLRSSLVVLGGDGVVCLFGAGMVGLGLGQGSVGGAFLVRNQWQ